MTPATVSHDRGFTLLELIVSLVLLALLSGVLFGAVRLAGRSTDGGDAKAAASASMRLAEQFLRANLEAQHPLRMRKIVDWPLLFSGTNDEMRYTARLPARVASGGIWFYRLVVRGEEPHSPLVVERTIPDVSADTMPAFDNAERSVLAENIASLRIGYFGRDPDAGPTAAPSWHDQWNDAQRLPTMIRIDVTPKVGAPWPTLYVAPHESPEAGCRAWDIAREHCAAV
ncbi:MAG TPA: prepilin-type N-terminal cleavage/methylation domain-containing protein [Casimicrobiaceae bacterium]|jgi:general secretion pathway protein J|nr:prepilin-type N-terminal cleavage/methylation domain-containing protein [Casimicrobiaceae bacterium]